MIINIELKGVPKEHSAETGQEEVTNSAWVITNYSHMGLEKEQD